MPTRQIGAQMYTLREFCKTPADIAKTCKRLSDIGFGVVQASALGPIEPSELKKILDDHGLICAATHRSLDQLRDTESVIDEHQTLGCELTAIGGFAGKTRQEWQGFISEFSTVCKTLADRGLHVGYHNHSHELAPFASDPAKIDPADCPMRLLVDQLPPAAWFEIDTYWIAHGGADPAAWIDKVRGRIPAVHVKDMTITADREQKMCEIGRGNLNWPRILDACRAADVRYYLIERDRGDLDPFESLKISLEQLQAMGLN